MSTLAAKPGATAGDRPRLARKVEVHAFHPPVVVTGGTGTLGRHVVRLLVAMGREVLVLSRHAPAHRTPETVRHIAADLSEPRDVPSVAAAAAGAGSVVHLAGSARGDDIKTRRLMEAVDASGDRPHIVYMSVVGVDRTPVVSAADRAMFGYLAAKLASEQVVERSGLPWTTLRATQFHDLVLRTMQTLARMPVMVVPSGTRMQPVDTAEVAARIVELALVPACGLVPDFAGPQVHGMEDLARSYLRATGKRRPAVGMRMPGRAAQAFRDGANVSPSARSARAPGMSSSPHAPRRGKTSPPRPCEGAPAPGGGDRGRTGVTPPGADRPRTDASSGYRSPE